MKNLLLSVLIAGVVVSGAYYYTNTRNPGATQTVIPRFPIDTHTLTNGLEVFLLEDHRLPQVSVDIWYHVGPVNEEPGRTGFAHLFEHMMFQKSKHTERDSFLKYLESAGASDLEGSTSFDQTFYYETVPSNQLELVLWLESDRMGYLLDDLTEEDFANQQDVVRNERRERVENAPFGIVEETVSHLLYPKGHPYYASVIGSHADIQAARFDDVKAFFKQYYVPNNASMVIAGDINKADTLRLVEKYFGTLKRGADVPRVKVTTPPITEERRMVVKDRIELPRLYMAWIVPEIFTEEDALADITAALLGGDKVSRLHKSLVYEKRIAQDVFAYTSSRALGSVLQITATAAPDHTLEELEKEIDVQLELLRTKAPEAAELTGTVQGIERGILFAMERNSEIADRINTYNHFGKPPDFFREDIGRYRKATPEGIRSFVEKYLTKNSRVVVYGEPGEQDLGTPVPTPNKVASNKGGESVNADEAWRSMPPAPGPAPTIHLPTPESFQLPNGVTVLLDSRKGLPTVASILSLRGGMAANPVTKPGLAAFMVDMLDEGTTTLSSQAYAEKLKQAGAAIQEVAAQDSSSLALTMTRGNAGAAFDLLADAVMNPVFSKEEVERVRKQRLGQLIQMKEDPGEIANLVTTLSLLGKDHPYAYDALGTPESLQAISVEDLQSFWKSQATPRNASIIVSGDFSKDELLSLLEKSFGKWSGGDAPAIQINPPSPQRRLVVVDTPGAQQTQIRVAKPGPARSTPDYEKLDVMNMILGGAFSSRINLNLRERHGYTYGAGSSIIALAHGGWIATSSGVRTDVTDKAVAEILKEISRMRTDPITDEEMTLAKSSLVRALPGRFETTMGVVRMYYEIPVYKLPLDYYSQYSSRVSAVTAADVQEVAKKYLTPEELLIVAVGDRNAIERGLKRLGWSPLELRDAEGNVK
jgi:zinc protease